MSNFIVERKGGWYVTRYLKEKDNEQNIGSSRAVSQALKFSKKEEAKALSILVSGKVVEIKE